MADDTRGGVAIDAAGIAAVSGAQRYPGPFRAACAGRHRRALGDAFGIANFGAALTVLDPGAASSQRHWHTRQDELIYILEGTPTLVTDAGEQLLSPGMVAGFPANSGDGHHLVNRSDAPVLYLEIGDRAAGDEVDYPDIDMVRGYGPDGEVAFLHRDGTPY